MPLSLQQLSICSINQIRILSPSSNALGRHGNHSALQHHICKYES
jgi:hypothetical protein